MASGKRKHEERQEAVSFWGKDLARRAKRRCEVCEGEGSLLPFDTDPDVEPALDTLVLLCGRCRGLLEGQKCDSRELRFLEAAIWNETSAVAAVAKKMLEGVDVAWAREALENLG